MPEIKAVITQILKLNHELNNVFDNNGAVTGNTYPHLRVYTSITAQPRFYQNTLHLDLKKLDTINSDNFELIVLGAYDNIVGKPHFLKVVR